MYIILLTDARCTTIRERSSGSVFCINYQKTKSKTMQKLIRNVQEIVCTFDTVYYFQYALQHWRNYPLLTMHQLSFLYMLSSRSSTPSRKRERQYTCKKNMSEWKSSKLSLTVITLDVCASSSSLPICSCFLRHWRLFPKLEYPWRVLQKFPRWLLLSGLVRKIFSVLPRVRMYGRYVRRRKQAHGVLVDRKLRILRARVWCAWSCAQYLHTPENARKILWLYLKKEMVV